MRFLRWLVVLLAWLACSCARPPTQLVVVVESDLPLSELGEIHVVVAPIDAPAGHVPSEHSFTVGDGALGLPLSFGVTPPAGDPRRRVEVVVEGRSRGGALIVARRVRTGFVAQQSLRLPVFLADACRDVDCATSPGTSCDRGICVVIDVEPGSLVPVRPGEELRDAGARDGDIFVQCPAAATIPSSGASPVAIAGFPDVPRHVVAFHDGASAVAYFVEEGTAPYDPWTLPISEAVRGVAAVTADIPGVDGGPGAAFVAFELVGGVEVYYVSLIDMAMTALGGWPGHRLVSRVGVRRAGEAAFLIAPAGASPVPLFLGLADASGGRGIAEIPGSGGMTDAWLTSRSDGGVVVVSGAGAASCGIATFELDGAWTTSPGIATGSPCSLVSAVELPDRTLLLAWSDASAPAGSDASAYAFADPLDAGYTQRSSPLTLPGSRPGRPLVFAITGVPAVSYRRADASAAVGESLATAWLHDLDSPVSLSWQATSPMIGSEVGAVGGGGLSLLTGFRGDGSVVIERPCLP